jgi:hypothetical protein
MHTYGWGNMTTPQANGQYCRSNRLSITGRLCKSLGMTQTLQKPPLFYKYISHIQELFRNWWCWLFLLLNKHILICHTLFTAVSLYVHDRKHKCCPAEFLLLLVHITCKDCWDTANYFQSCTNHTGGWHKGQNMCWDIWLLIMPMVYKAMGRKTSVNTFDTSMYKKRNLLQIIFPTLN